MWHFKLQILDKTSAQLINDPYNQYPRKSYECPWWSHPLKKGNFKIIFEELLGQKKKHNTKEEEKVLYNLLSSKMNATKPEDCLLCSTQFTFGTISKVSDYKPLKIASFLSSLPLTSAGKSIFDSDFDNNPRGRELRQILEKMMNAEGGVILFGVKENG